MGEIPLLFYIRARFPLKYKFKCQIHLFLKKLEGGVFYLSEWNNDSTGSLPLSYKKEI